MKMLRVILLAAMASCVAAAHPGGLDSNGGHTDRKTGTYHYHRQQPSSAASSQPSSSAAQAPSVQSGSFATLPTARRATTTNAPELEKKVEQQAAEITNLLERIQTLEAKVKLLEAKLSDGSGTPQG